MMTIFHRKEPRDLSAAVRLYLEREHAGAHSAEADVLASLEVLDAQLGRYEDLPRTVEELDGWCKPKPAWKSAKFIWRDGKAIFAFGKFQGRSLKDVARTRPDYLEWILRSDFPPDARELVEKALQGESR